MISVDLAYVLVSVIITFFFPLFSIPINFFGLVFTKRTRKISIVLLALALALVAYAWTPPISADLYRHHLEMSSLGGFSISQLFEYSLKELNFLQVFTEAMVFRTGNNNFLQLIIVFIGYYEIFWIICDYAKKREIRNAIVALTLIVAIVSLKYIDFISGLWFNFAIINFAMGVYLKHIKNTKKLHYLCFVVSVLSHISVLYMLVVLLLVEKTNIFKKVSIIGIVTLFLAFSGIGFFLNYAYSNFDFHFVAVLQKMYESYFLQEKFNGANYGWNLYIAVVNISCSILVTVISRLKEKNQYNSFLLAATVSTLALMIQSGIFIRFVYLVVLLAIVPFMDIVNTKVLSKKKLLTIVCFCVLISLNTYRQIEQMREYDFINNVLNNYIGIGDEI